MQKRSKKNKILWILLGITVGIVTAGYLVISFYFMDRFYFGSTINGKDYTGKTVTEVEQDIDDDIGTYRLELLLRGGDTETITAQDIQLKYVSDGMVSKLKEEQNPFLWFVEYFRKKDHEMTVTTTYDQAAFDERFNDLLCFDKTKVRIPADAYLDFQENKYVIVKEEIGNQVNKENLYQLVTEAVKTGEAEISLEENECYVTPKVTSKNKKMNKAMQTLNQYVKTTIHYDFGDRSELLDAEIIHNWLSYDSKYKISIDEQAVIDYIKTLEASYNTLGKSRAFQTTSGKTVNVPSGNYGFMISRGREKEAILSLMKEGAVVTREPEYAQRAYVREINDIGDTYVEINLKKQYMWFYKDGEVLVKTKIVTGNTSKKHGTPKGVFGITYKERNAVLRGEDYTTPVNYWLPFNGDIGIHDATWRKKFGGKIYQKEGSHGCVNTPFKNAKKIYENIEKGMPVICY